MENSRFAEALQRRFVSCEVESLPRESITVHCQVIERPPSEPRMVHVSVSPYIPGQRPNQIPTDEDLRRKLLADALGEMRQFEARFRHLEELASVLKPMRELIRPGSVSPPAPGASQ